MWISRVKHRAGHPRGRSIVTLVSGTGEESVLRWYARIIAGRRSAYGRLVRAGTPASRGCVWKAPLGDAVASLARASSAGFLVADWGRSMQQLQELLQCASERDVPAVLVRQVSLEGLCRVVVATSGGPHATRLMWVAREISEKLNVPLRVVRLRRHDDSSVRGETVSGNSRRNAVLENWTSGLLGIDAPAEVLSAPDLAGGIVGYLRMGDLLVMGSPGPFYIGTHFDESIPAVVAKRVSTPIVLLRSPSPAPILLRSVFWGRLSQAELRPRDKQEAIGMLVDALVRHHQVPPSTRTDLVERAVRREWVMSTAVDCETAFPHIRLPGFRGVAGSMAICPEGVDFGSADGAPTRFIFLLVTPDGYCDEHLTVQAKIARRMLRAEVRKALLECTSSEEILDVIEPHAPP